MPELPEVETTRRGIQDVLTGRQLISTTVREPRFRWPVVLPENLAGQRLNQIKRRGKYLLFSFDGGTLILHLGMSGHLRVVTPKMPLGKHDHIDFVFDQERILRFNDPRRFGSVHWTEEDPYQHSLLKDLGPEPLGEDFDGVYLFQQSRKRSTPVKNFIMNSHVVVGVGNIYANESLFRSKIRPSTKAGRISKKQYSTLVSQIKETLTNAIEVGGTTLRDYLGSNGEPGYFGLKLDVYGRAGEPCNRCGHTLKGTVLGQRQTVHCPKCQVA